MTAPPEIRDASILVVDDQPATWRLVSALLDADGYSRVAAAENGELALEMIAADPPGLIILDIMMPGIDGFEVCRRLRARPATRPIPVLVLTALDTAEQRSQIFKVGATDVVSKPVHGPELLARVRVHLQNHRLVTELGNYRQRVLKELESAREMQNGLLPPFQAIERAAQASGTQIDAHMETSSELGGDFWGLHDLGEGRLGVFLADFTGHGVLAAINTVRLHTLLTHRPVSADPGGSLAALNEDLSGLLETGQFATMLYGVIDRHNRRFTYASAGACAPLLLDGQGDATFLDPSGLPLGITQAGHWDSRDIALPETGALFLYSDGLSEAMNGEGGLLGEDGVLALAKAARREGDPDSPLQTVLEGLYRHTKAPPTDDVSLVWVGW